MKCSARQKLWNSSPRQQDTKKASSSQQLFLFDSFSFYLHVGVPELHWTKVNWSLCIKRLCRSHTNSLAHCATTVDRPTDKTPYHGLTRQKETKKTGQTPASNQAHLKARIVKGCAVPGCVDTRVPQIVSNGDELFAGFFRLSMAIWRIWRNIRLCRT